MYLQGGESFSAVLLNLVDNGEIKALLKPAERAMRRYGKVLSERRNEYKEYSNIASVRLGVMT